MATNKITLEQGDLITTRIRHDDFKSQTSKISNESDKSCPVDHLVRSRSFVSNDLQVEANIERQSPAQVELNRFTNVSVTIFERLKPDNCKFIQLDDQSNMSNVYNSLVGDCEEEKHEPTLILSVYGGVKYFIMPEKLEKEIIRGIIEAATTTDAWILTMGVNNGVSKLIGEGISHYRLLREYSDKIKCIGLTMWGILNENTRSELEYPTLAHLPGDLIKRQISENIQDEKQTIERNHSHCILFQDGSSNKYLNDSYRNDLVTHACKNKNHTCDAVTIIIEGDIDILEILEHDIAARRPIVLIQGSGRLADVLALLIEQMSHTKLHQQLTPIDEDIQEAFEQFFPNLEELDMSLLIKTIQSILQKENRHLLNVFSLDRDGDVGKTIFKAIFAMKNKREESAHLDSRMSEEQRRRDDFRLINLALEWNYIDGVLPILQSRQDIIRKKGSEYNEEEMKYYKQLFQDSLKKNRSTFVEYILAAGFDPRILLTIHNTEQRETELPKLYQETYKQMEKSHAKCVETIFGNLSIKIVEKLDQKLNKFVGAFIGTIYKTKEDNRRNRIYINMRNHVCTCCGSRNKENDQSIDQDKKSSNQNNNNEPSYSKDEILRDLFLWSIFMDMPEMSKILLVHLQTRTCAALIASAIFKQYAKVSTTVDHKEKYRNQALDFEIYAAMAIDKCYEYNERFACELLLREVPLFGNVTCMQVAISSEARKLVGTHCFDLTLNQVWYNKLSMENNQTYAKISQFFSIISLGFVAPWMISYREEESEGKDEQLSSEGINWYIVKKKSEDGQSRNYWSRFLYFHDSPMIKMCYHFISYIFFLLVFSYMMLYNLDSPDTFTIPHWTEIYVIITVSTMLCEEIRKIYHEYKTRMLERWGGTGSILLTFSTNVFYILPYFLFYFGLVFRYRGYNDGILTTARIIWAFDLELWYIRSLKFIVVLKSVGPKLLMLKNMIRDLAAFVYMIFIAIAAYGVVSRALILYKQIPFTAASVLGEIFYEPYWFIYGEVSDKHLLDEKLDSDSGSTIAEAIATHVLLAFHMLFINILILNLLIAVFTDTIQKVEENTEFYWRYQSYSFIREYFERPPLAYPPLIIVPHIALACLALQRKCCSKLCRNKVGDENSISKLRDLTRIFKMISIREKTIEQWNDFENAATYSYARSIVEKNTRKSDDGMKPISDQQEMITNLNKEIFSMRSILNDNQKNITEINTQMKHDLQQVTESLRWIMNTMKRVK